MARALFHALIIAMCFYGSASAAPINYVVSVIATGSVGGREFSNAVMKLTGTGDTQTVIEPQPAFFENTLSSLSFTIDNVSVGEFLGQFHAFSTDTGFGFGTLSTSDVFDTTYPNYTAFDLNETLDPVEGYVFGPGGTFATTAGSLAFVIQSQSSVSASLPEEVLEPTSFSIVLAALILVVLPRRRLQSAHRHAAG